LQNFKEDETGGRDKERYDEERVDPGDWMVYLKQFCDCVQAILHPLLQGTVAIN